MCAFSKTCSCTCRSYRCINYHIVSKCCNRSICVCVTTTTSMCCVTVHRTSGSSYYRIVRVNVNDNRSVFVKLKASLKPFRNVISELTATDNKSCFTVFIGLVNPYVTLNITACDITCTAYDTLVAGKVIIPVVNINCRIILSCACVNDCSAFKVKNTVNTDCNLLRCADSSLALNCKSLVDTNVQERITCVVVISVCGSNAMTVKVKCEITSNFTVIFRLNIEILRSFYVSKKHDYVTVYCCIKSFLKCFKLNIADLSNRYKSVNVRINVRVITS